MAFKLRSPAFGPGGEIPALFTGAGADVSPPLRWSNPPEGTESFALIMDDHEERIWVHWVLYGIPATVRELPEGVPRQDIVPGVGSQGLNDFGSGCTPWIPPSPYHRAGSEPIS